MSKKSTPPATPQPEHLFTPLDRLNADLKAAAATLSPAEVRYYTSRYYQMQEERKRAALQMTAAQKQGKPNTLLLFDLQQSRKHERIIHTAMQINAQSSLAGRWLLSQFGVGPVIASGILAHLDITKAPYAGHFWSFAGLNAQQRWLSRVEADAWVKAHSPVDEDTVLLASETFHRKHTTLWHDATIDWKTGEAKKLTAVSLAAALARCPYNQELKVLCWKFADVAKKFSNQHVDDNLYGQLYKAYKVRALQKDAAGEFGALAAQTLDTRAFRDAATKAVYESGHFPAGRIDLWAMRATIKMFLAHVHHVLFILHYHREPPLPYILAHHPEQHAQYIPPPHWPFEQGKAYAVASEEEDGE